MGDSQGPGGYVKKGDDDDERASPERRCQRAITAVPGGPPAVDCCVKSEVWRLSHLAAHLRLPPASCTSAGTFTSVRLTGKPRRATRVR